MGAGGFDQVGIIGGGAWGTALAHVAAIAGRRTTLWVRDVDVVSALNAGHGNRRYLPDMPVSGAIDATTDLSAIGAADLVLLVTPAQTTGAVAERLKPVLRPGCPVVICAKGLDRASNRLLSDILTDRLPEAVPAVLSGPGFAVDVARGLPTAVTIGATDEMIAAAICAALSGPSFRPYHSVDMVGIQIGGALKNVLAIAAGIVVGRGLGASAHAALIARGFAEMSRLGVALGARQQTLAGLSGLGDLVLTCSNRQSRNFSFGIELGEGQPLDALTGPGAKLVEGAHTAAVAVSMAGRHGIDMPICGAVADVVEGRKTIDAVIAELMARPLKREDL